MQDEAAHVDRSLSESLRRSYSFVVVVALHRSLRLAAVLPFSFAYTSTIV